MNAALKGMSYHPPFLFLGSVMISVATSDLGNTGGRRGEDRQLKNALTVGVTYPNTVPVNTVPAAQTVNEDGNLLFSAAGGNAISVADCTAGGAAVKVTLSATNGTLYPAGHRRATFLSGDGSSDGSMSFTDRHAGRREQRPERTGLPPDGRLRRPGNGRHPASRSPATRRPSTVTSARPPGSRSTASASPGSSRTTARPASSLPASAHRMARSASTDGASAPRGCADVGVRFAERVSEMTPADRVEHAPGDAPDGIYPWFTASLIPRAIAWVSSVSAAGADNLAPHSFTTVAAVDPPTVCFVSVGAKDTLANVRATGESCSTSAAPRCWRR